MKFYFAILMYASLGSFQAAITKGDLSSEFTNSAALDEAEKLTLYWSVDWNARSISFAVEAQTTGWVGFGISTGRGQMIGADIVIGGVTDNGNQYFSDRYASSYSTPESDSSQDYKLISLTETDGKTTMKFERKFDTCDDKDNKIEEGTSKVIFAYNDADPTSSGAFLKHTYKGSRSVMLLNTGGKTTKLPANMSYLDILNNKTKVPGNKTVYWCSVFEIPRMEKKHHVVKVEPIVQKGHEGLVHHILVYECSYDFPTAFLNHSGHCYDRSTPEAIMRCAGQSTVAAWAIGGGSFYYPEHVGMKIGTDGTPRYIVMETHYDNPDKRTDFVDSSGLRFWYTEQTRMYDTGVIYAGWGVQHHMMIPPKQKEWKTIGYCAAPCTEKVSRLPFSALEKSPLQGHKIKIFAALLHTHYAGRKVHVHHIRNGKELKEIVYDNHYDFNFQEYQMLKEEVEVFPGDEFIVACTYDTEDRNQVTFGGLQTLDEMCLAFLMYYPSANFTKCASVSKDAANRFFSKYAWNGTHSIPFPPKIWTSEMTQDLRAAYDADLELKLRCKAAGNRGIQGVDKARKPRITSPYKPVESCLTTKSSANDVTLKTGRTGYLFVAVALVIIMRVVF
ncbi:unnamed protein product [Porites evermanni]|uniref:DOMON domain-containing protein n=1 Tax=Porites evermanni TaxID=104178 RepID=A0ABN8QK89_9CNID|nr:unnamed protein product [Porites evermanni]